MAKRILAIACWVGVVAAMAGYGQAIHKITAQVDHPFLVSGKELPAGRYLFELDAQTHKTVRVQSADGKFSALGMIVTGISSPVGTPEQPRLVFDNFEGKRCLSEVWMAGHPGFLISGFRDDTDHQHTTVKAGNPQ